MMIIFLSINAQCILMKKSHNSCILMNHHWLRPRNPLFPRILAHIWGRYWSAKIDDISLGPPVFYERVWPTSISSGGFSFTFIGKDSVFIHCKDKMPKIWNKYSQERNIGASVPISTFMFMWANYIIPRWVCLSVGRNMWTDPGNI